MQESSISQSLLRSQYIFYELVYFYCFLSGLAWFKVPKIKENKYAFYFSLSYVNGLAIGAGAVTGSSHSTDSRKPFKFEIVKLN